MLFTTIEKMVITVKILLKEFDTILKDIKNNGKTTKSLNVKSRGAINLYPH